MLDHLLQPGLMLTGLAAAMIAGCFLTFSDFIMRALGASAPAAGAEAMQQVNRKVFRSVFMVLFLGLVPVSMAIFAVAVAWVAGAAKMWMMAGALFYVLGVFAVTGLGNVPMNERLDKLDHLSVEGQSYWRHYNARWTRLNHVRTVFSVLAAGAWLTAATL